MVKNNCVICTDNIKKKNLVALACCHIYHIDCVIELVRKRTRKCPLCRNRISWNISQLKKHKELFK